MKPLISSRSHFIMKSNLKYFWFSVVGTSYCSRFCSDPLSVCLSVLNILSPWVKSSTFTMVWSCLQMMVKSTFLTVSSTIASFCSTRYHFSVITNITQPEPRQVYLPTLITKLQNFRLSVIPSLSGYTRCSMGGRGAGEWGEGSRRYSLWEVIKLWGWSPCEWD